MGTTNQSADRSVPGDSTDPCWMQVEELVARLHDLARSATSPVDFYYPLLQQVVELLAALGGMVWIRPDGPMWQCLCRLGPSGPGSSQPVEVGGQAGERAWASQTQQRILDSACAGMERTEADQPSTAVVSIHAVDARGEVAGAAEQIEAVHLFCPVFPPTVACNGDSSGQIGLPEPIEPTAPVVVEIVGRPGCPAEVEQGWQRLLAVVCLTAADYHQMDELRELRLKQRSSRQPIELVRRAHRSLDLKQTAFEVVNEGRRLTGCDRLSLLMAKAGNWRLLAVSGAVHVEKRADVTVLLRQLARQTVRWGEPVRWSDHDGEGALDYLPPELSWQIGQFVDRCHGRQLEAVPLEFKPDQEEASQRRSAQREPDPRRLPEGVLIAEWFTVARGELIQPAGESVELPRLSVVEVARLCEPALRQAELFDRLPIRLGRLLAGWSDRLATSIHFGRSAALIVCLLALVAALVWIPCEYEVSAPAMLRPRIEQDLFATCDGTVVDVRRQHGDRVEPGEVLAVLDDPGLTLELQRVLGEIETVQKQLDAVLATRTDRSGNSEATEDGLPWAAHEQRMSQRLENLQQQRKILDHRRQALTLRSPIAGQLLTLDVGDRLLARPVRRGEVLLTVADLKSGWRLQADLPQDRLGAVLAAQSEVASSSGPRPGNTDAVEQEGLAVRFRLADDSGATYTGRVEQISATTLFDTRELTDEVPPVRVDIRVDAADLPTGRPGMSAEARIACGRRSLGYVWLNDLWETLVRWIIF
jgi:biotin/lipoyl-binding protein